MRKLILILATIMVSLTVNGGNVLGDTWDEGVSYSTITHSSHTTLCFVGQGVLVGIHIASITFRDADYITFRDTESTLSARDETTTNEFYRLYIPSITLVSATEAGTLIFDGGGMQPTMGFDYMLSKPLRVKRGLGVRPSYVGTPRMTILWDKRGE